MDILDEFIRLRKQIGTRQEVADLLGYSEPWLMKLEQGRRPMRWAYLYALRYLADTHKSNTKSKNE